MGDRLAALLNFATLSGDSLRAAATNAGIKATGTIKALRDRCAGNMPNYRPAQSHAPGPSAPAPDADEAEPTDQEHDDAAE